MPTPSAIPKTTAKKNAKKVFMGAKSISLDCLSVIYAQLFISLAGGSTTAGISAILFFKRVLSPDKEYFLPHNFLLMFA
jgi:hypothetical protein